MPETNETTTTGRRAPANSMLKSRSFYVRLGEDMRQLGLAALVGSVAMFFPTEGLLHPVYGAMLLMASMLSYGLGAYLTFQNENGGQK